MRLKTQLMQARLIEPDQFIYLKKEKRFFWVDDVERIDKGVVFFFEEGIDKNGLVEYTVKFDRYKLIPVVIRQNTY